MLPSCTDGWVLPALPQVETVAGVLQTADAIGCEALRKDCLNFLVDNTEQVERTPGFKRLVEKKPTIMMDFVKLIAPRVKKPRIGGC